MKNRQLFKQKRHSYTNSVGHTHTFTTVVSIGIVEVPAEKGLSLAEEAVVEVKVFNAVVNLVVEDAKGKFVSTRTRNYEILCSRSDHANCFLRDVQSCKTMKEVDDLVIDLHVDFQDAIRRDVRKASRKLAGLQKPITNTLVPSGLKEPTPLRKRYPYWGKQSRR